MAENFKEKAENCYKNADYKGYFENSRKQYELTKDEQDKINYEKALNLYEISKEMNEIINSDHEDYYKILGVSENASIDEIKKAFRAKAFKFHPDRLKIEGSTTAMRIIQKAYFEINTEEKKATYDAKKRVPKFFRNMMPNEPSSTTDTSNFMRPFFMYSYHASPGFRFSSSGGFEDFVFSNRNEFSSMNEIYRQLYRTSTRRRQEVNVRSIALHYLFYIIIMMLIVFTIS